MKKRFAILMSLSTVSVGAFLTAGVATASAQEDSWSWIILRLFSY